MDTNRENNRQFYEILFLPCRASIVLVLVATGPLQGAVLLYAFYTQVEKIDSVYIVGLWSWLATGLLYLVLDYKIMPDKCYRSTTTCKIAIIGILSGPLVWLKVWRKKLMYDQ